MCDCIVANVGYMILSYSGLIVCIAVIIVLLVICCSCCRTLVNTHHLYFTSIYSYIGLYTVMIIRAARQLRQVAGQLSLLSLLGR